MIKRVIFDVDNTLIAWKDEYILPLRKVLDQLQVPFTEEQFQCADNCVVEYEKYHDIYINEDFVDFVSKRTGLSLPIEFADLLIKEQGVCFEEDLKLVEMIKYLSEKYELMVLSNWYTETQKARLKGLGILEYFSIVSGGDERPLKPNLKAFETVLKGCNPSECLMIGDNLHHDIIPALELGLQVYWLTKEKSDKYPTISSIYDLKNIL